MASDFSLGISGFKFSDLYRCERLKDLHEAFWDFCDKSAPTLRAQFETLDDPSLPLPQHAEILIQGARALDAFLVKLFKIGSDAETLREQTETLQPIFQFKKDFLNIQVFKRLGEPACPEAEFQKLTQKLAPWMKANGVTDEETAFATNVTLAVRAQGATKAGPAAAKLDAASQKRLDALVKPHGSIEAALKDIGDWCVQVWVDPNRRKRIASWVSYIRAGKLDFENLVEAKRPDPALPEMRLGEHLRFRDGFKLTDNRMDTKQALREIDYCILCHQREKDSCSHGFPEKTGGYKPNPLGIALEGCPLDERISEMHLLRKEGLAVGALSMIMLDNPMCPGTGHRICNDCMKGCIYQKQDPVNIPQAETAVLTDVLSLPYGFEIYSLLSRFNPINRKRPYALPYNGNDVLVVGLGPAGYTLSHYLANEGFGVVGIDGLKLEPLPDKLTGKDRDYPEPIRDFNDLKNELDERILLGFGGVSEYGITVRWDKNFLLVIYLTLVRRQNLRFYGGVRFGGTLTLQDAWELGFQHVGIATGAGKPTLISMKNNLSKGIRKASDFLMALQLTGAFKKASMANLQIRLPAVVIGGGLTAVDTATELFAYYPLQVEKALDRFETLVKELGEGKAWELCDAEEKEILTVFLEHGKQVREERVRAAKEKRPPNFISLVRSWGGVSVVYRKRMQDCPAYRLNHEELIKALEEGVSFTENLTPTEAVRDQYGWVQEMEFSRAGGGTVRLPARSVMVAAGTSPNTIYEREYPGTFNLDAKGTFFKKYHCRPKPGGKPTLEEAAPGDREAFFLSHETDGKFVSFYGDNHPDFAGNVVKAMASAKKGVRHVCALFTDDIKKAEKKGASVAPYEKLIKHLDETLVPRVVRVDRLTPTIVEVIVKGRYVSRKFEPGQFYRLQNYETTAAVVDGSRLAMEGLALTGAWVDKKKDLLSLIVLEMGGSSRLCSTLKKGEPVVVMGPTGTPSEIPAGETVLLAGGGLGNAVLLSVAKALREKGSKVVYFAAYRSATDVFKREELEGSTDQIIWSTDREPPILPSRPDDIAFVGNIVQAMQAYGSGKLKGPPRFPLSTVDRILAIGSDRMMAAVQKARETVLAELLKPGHVGIASINSPMQCMMKEVCAQCLQKHKDPKTGKEYVVFSCFNQDQPMECVDFQNLNERLKQNSLAEKLSNRYLDTLLEQL